MKISVCLGLLKPSTHSLCQRHFGLDFVENPGVGLQAIRVTQSACTGLYSLQSEHRLLSLPTFPSILLIL